MNHEPDTKTTLHLIGKLPPWFAIIATLTYATGFLVEFTFFDWLGVRGAANDIFKARYIHVGFLFLQFPVSLLALILAYVKLMAIIRKVRRQASATNPEPGASAIAERLRDFEVFKTSILLLVTLLGGFYVLVTFARPGIFSQNQALVCIFFFVIIFGLIAIRELERHVVFKTPEAKRNFGYLARLLCLAVAWIIGLVLFWNTIPICWVMLREGGYLCYGCLGLIGFIFHRLIKRFAEIPDASYRNTITIIAIAVLGALYYIAVLSFASRVYPFIPVIKGGGDYSTEKKAVLSFSMASTNSVPTQLIDGAQIGLCSVPVTIIEETGSSYIISTNDPSRWQWPGQTNKPDIITIKKDLVTAVTFKRPN